MRQFWAVITLLALLAGCTQVPEIPQVVLEGAPKSPAAVEAVATEALAVAPAQVARVDAPAPAEPTWAFDFRGWIAKHETRALADFLADVPGPENPAIRSGMKIGQNGKGRTA